MTAPRADLTAMRLTVLKQGAHFLHATWINDANAPLECVVTRIAKGIVYWRPAAGGKPMYFPADDSHKHVWRVLD